jgi:hypothetical protein
MKYEMAIRQFDRIACFLRRQRIVKRYPRTLYLLSFDSSVTVLRGNRVVAFVWFWMGIFYKGPCGLMDKAPASGAGDCRLESCQGRKFFTFPRLLIISS